MRSLFLALITIMTLLYTGEFQQFGENDRIVGLSSTVTVSQSSGSLRKSLKGTQHSDELDFQIKKTPQRHPITRSGSTYISSDGVRVSGPEAFSQIPAGATAICWDGTYSKSRHRRGTCSHHGGVRKWLRSSSRA